MNHFPNLVKLVKSIVIVQETGDDLLDVKHHGTFATWNSYEDKGWMRYSKARSYISRYKWINKLLVALKIIKKG